MAYTFDKELKNWRNPFSQNYNAEDLSDIVTNDVDVNTTIKPIDRKNANLELERGEFAFLPSGNLYRVIGKPHSKGGTPANLPGGSFIYSKFKPLNIDKKDAKLFEFKKGGTPAEVLKSEVDYEHHNKMMAILDSNDHDEISKVSASLMIKKNLKKLGQIALLQEEKKGFPDGLPDFADGVFPKEDTQTEIMKEQYKTGGFTSLRKFQPGGISEEIKKKARRVGVVDDNYNEIGKDGNNTYYSDSNGNPVFLPLAPGGRRTNNDQSYINQLRNDPRFNTQSWEDLANGHYVSKDSPLKNSWTPQGGNEDYVYRHVDAGETVPIERGTPNVPSFDRPFHPLIDTPGIGTGTGTDEDQQILPYEPNVPFSPWQKLNLGYAAYNAASIGRYDPKREQLNFTPLSLRRPNSQPYLNAVDNQTYQAYQTNRFLNPILARANNSSLYGRGLEQKSQVLGNLDNQIGQIDNQEAQYNNQGINNTANQNANFDQTYYDQVQRVNQNFENEKRMGRNQFVSLVNSYKSQNDALELGLASQETFGSVWEDSKTGKKYPNVSDDVAKQLGLIKRAAPLYDYNNKTNKVYYTGSGINLNSLSSGNSQSNQLQELIKQLIDGGLDPKTAAKSASYFLRPTRQTTR